MRHSSRGHNQYIHTSDPIKADPAFQNYVNYLRGIRNNNGQVSSGVVSHAIGAVWNFLDYVDIPMTDHALSDLIAFKQRNPNEASIEKALVAFASEPPFVKSQAQRASAILGIFNRGNFTRLNCRINTHFEPKQKENCSWKVFLQIFAKLTPEQQAMIQWGLYVPQRARAAYLMSFDKINMSSDDYAIVTIEPTVGINKARVRHPCFVPKPFARKIVDAAIAAGRTCPFPDHKSEWRKITALAKGEFGVHLVSKNLRKFFVKAANQARLRPDFAAFVMGDKTKLNAVAGHMPLIYDPDLREEFWSEIAAEITRSGIIDLITLSPHDPINRLEEIQQQIAALQEQAQRLQIR